MRLFKDKSVLVTYNPDLHSKNQFVPPEDKIPHPDKVKLITEKTKEVVKYVALAAVGTYAAVKTIDTISQIAVKKTKSADNEK